MRWEAGAGVGAGREETPGEETKDGGLQQGRMMPSLL